VPVPSQLDRPQRAARFRVVVMALAVAVAVMGVVPAVAGAGGSPCRVTIAGGTKVYRSLSAAIVAAQRGKVLSVSGVCASPVTVDKPLTIRGTERARATTLNGAGLATSVLVSAVGVRLENLTILGGAGTITTAANLHVGVGAGVDLVDVKVLGGNGVKGGAISGTTGSTIRLVGRTLVSGGQATEIGGGINVDGGTVVMEDRARIAGATAETGGGAIMLNNAVFRMSDRASVRASSTTDDSSLGGGIAAMGSTLIIEDDARVTGNIADIGGGILLLDSTLTLRGRAVVSANVARGQPTIGGDDGAGGILAVASTVRISGTARIEGNTAPVGSVGGGLRLRSTSTLFVNGSVATCTSPATLLRILDNTPDDCHAE